MTITARRRSTRSVILVAAILLSLGFALVVAPSSAGAATPQRLAAAGDGCGNWRPTNFYVDTRSCLSYDGTLRGQSRLDFQPSFGKSRVIKCSVYVQLVSDYGSQTTKGPIDCTAQAQAGGSPLPLSSDWGPGRREGGTYRMYTWVDIDSLGGKYRGRSAASVSASVRKPCTGQPCPQ